MYCGRCGTWVPAGEPACASCGWVRSAEPVAAPTPAAAAAPAAGPGAAAFTAASTQFPAVPLASAPHFAGFWRRLAASFVDGLVLFFPNAIVRVLAGFPSPLSLRTIPDDQVGRSLVLTGITTLVYWWYCARLESSHWQGTLGQQLMGMRVTDLHGRRISFMRATGRFFAQWLSFVLCCTGYLFNLWSTRRQTLHDMIAGCVFVVGGTVPASVPPPAPAPLVEQAP